MLLLPGRQGRDVQTKKDHMLVCVRDKYKMETDTIMHKCFGCHNGLWALCCSAELQLKLGSWTFYKNSWNWKASMAKVVQRPAFKLTADSVEMQQNVHSGVNEAIEALHVTPNSLSTLYHFLYVPRLLFGNPLLRFDCSPTHHGRVVMLFRVAEACLHSTPIYYSF